MTDQRVQGTTNTNFWMVDNFGKIIEFFVYKLWNLISKNSQCQWKITRDMAVVKRTKYSHEKFCSGTNNNEENKTFFCQTKNGIF